MNKGVGKRISASGWILAITALGAALRLYRLDSQSLWIDEAITFIIARESLSGAVFTPGGYVSMHALYYAIIHFVTLIGESEIFLRLPSVVLGTLSIPLLYLVAREWFGNPVGMASGLLLAISPFHLYYSQETRPYAALLFFALLSVVCLQRLASEREGVGWRLGFIFSTAATVYVHPEAIPFVAFTVLYVIVASRSNWARWGMTFAAILLLCAPMALKLAVAPPIKPVAATSYDDSVSKQSSGIGPMGYAAWTFGTGFSVGPSVRELRAPGRWRLVMGHAHVIVPVATLLFSLLLMGGIRMWRSKRRELLLIGAWFFLPIAFLFLAGALTGYPVNPRYVILSFPPFLLLLGFGLASLRDSRLRAAAWGFVALINLAALWNYYFDPRYYREDYRQIIRELAQASGPGDVVVVMAPYTRVMFRYYDPGPVERVPYPPPGTRFEPARLPADFAEITQDSEDFWVLLSRYEYIDPKDCLLKFLNTRYRRQNDLAVEGARLIHYSTSIEAVRPSPPTDGDPACYIQST